MKAYGLDMCSSRAKTLATKGSNIQSTGPVKMAGTDCYLLLWLLKTEAFTAWPTGHQSPEAVSLLPSTDS